MRSGRFWRSPIPGVLWPIDLIELPRRGPLPALKPETPLTLELMEDVGIAGNSAIGYPPEQYRAGLIERRQPQQQAPPQPTVVYQWAPSRTFVVQPTPQVVYRYVAPPPPPPVSYPYGYRYYGPAC